MNPNQPQQPPQKLIDFNADLKALADKYQYEVKPVLSYEPEGVFARLTVIDVSPKGVNFQPQPPVAPDPTDPNPEAPTEPVAPVDEQPKV